MRLLFESEILSKSQPCYLYFFLRPQIHKYFMENNLEPAIIEDFKGDCNNFTEI